jgi:hypothetical protein
MDDFSVKTRLTAKEYAKVMIIGLYKKPTFILTALFGLFPLIIVILDHFKIINYAFGTPFVELLCGLFILSAPSLITIIAVRQFISNPSFQHDIKYTFSERGMAVEGITFKGEFLWAHIIKQKEISQFLILYHSKRMGNFIDKRKLTLDQLQFIKTKVEHK